MVVVRVGLLESQEIFRRGVASCLGEEPGFIVRDGAVTDVDVLVTSPAHLSIVDPAVPAVVCTDHDLVVEPPVVAVLPRASLGVDQLVAAVRAAAAGLHVLSVNGLARPVLAERELAVLRCLADGMGTRDISRCLGYSERTIKSVIARSCDRLGTRTRAQAVAECYRLHLL